MKSQVLLESHLKSLKLPTFVREYERTARQCAQEDKDYAEFLLCLAGMEVAERQRKAVQRRLKQAGFPAEKELDGFDFGAIPRLNKKRILDLSRCAWVEGRENLVMVGPPGVGKTHLAVALGREACRRGLQVRFFTAVGLATAYAEAREERHLQRLENHIFKRHLIIVDELGYVPLGQGAAENLFNFISRCYERTSLIVTTNLPFSEWPQVLGDERMAGALLDRLTHRVHVLEMNGESYRLKAGRRAARITAEENDSPEEE
jgi:DNA replication protein DnaC